MKNIEDDQQNKKAKARIENQLLNFLTQNEEEIDTYIEEDTRDLHVRDFNKNQRRDLIYRNQPAFKTGFYLDHPKYTKPQLLEYIKCKSDPIYFIKKYIKIIHVDRGLVNFELYPYQEAMVKKIVYNRNTIFLTARQMGKTTIVAAILLWYMLFHDDKMIGILANKMGQAMEILSRITRMIENLPFFLQPGMTVLNKKSLECINGSAIKSFGTSSSSARGESFSIVYLDELAFVPNDMEFFESTYPVISSGLETKMIVTSTPKGKRGLFHLLWQQSESSGPDHNGFANMKVLWHQHPDRNEKWKEETKAVIGASRFAQEFECVFSSQDGTLISASYLEQCVLKEPVLVLDNGLDIIEDAQPENQYVIVVDTSRGYGLDNSAFVCVDVTRVPYRVVCKYKNSNISQLLYPDIIENTAVQYNNAKILVEINDGLYVAGILWEDLEYEGLIRVRKTAKFGQVALEGGSGPNMRMGIATSKQVKSRGCNSFKTLVESSKLEINDIDILDEMSTFIAKNNSYEADADCYDDLVMCLVLFSWLTTQEYFKELTDNDIRKRILEERIKREEAEILPFGLMSDGTESFEKDDELESFFF